MHKELNDLGENITFAVKHARYDARVKKLLANRSILAKIIHNTIPEFMHLSEKEISRRIEDVHIAGASAKPGETNDSVTGLPQESKVPGEGSLQYDIRFTIRLPADPGRKSCRFLINVEPMDRFPSTYQWMNRAQVYTARNVSDQLGRIRKMHYDDIAPVYSIWIMMSSPQKHANTVTLFSGMKKSDLNGHYSGRTGMNMMNIVLICLPKDGEEEKAHTEPSDLTGTLTALLSAKISTEEKMTALRRHGIETTENIKEDVAKMTLLGSSLLDDELRRGRRQGIMEGRRTGLEEGRKKGIAEGRAEGRAEGITESRKENALNMIRDGSLTVEQISRFSGLSTEEVKKLMQQA